MRHRSWRGRALTSLAGLSLAGLLGCNGNVDVQAPGASVRVRANDRGASVSVRTPDASVNVNAFGMQTLGGVGGGSIVTRCPPPPDSYPLPGVKAPPPGNPPFPPGGTLGAPPLKPPPIYGVDKGPAVAGPNPGQGPLGAPGSIQAVQVPGSGGPGYPGSTAPVGGTFLNPAADPGTVPEANPDFGDLVFREPIAPATR